MPSLPSRNVPHHRRPRLRIDSPGRSGSAPASSCWWPVPHPRARLRAGGGISLHLSTGPRPLRRGTALAPASRSPAPRGAWAFVAIAPGPDPWRWCLDICRRSRCSSSSRTWSLATAVCRRLRALAVDSETAALSRREFDRLFEAECAIEAYRRPVRCSSSTWPRRRSRARHFAAARSMHRSARMRFGGRLREALRGPPRRCSAEPCSSSSAFAHPDANWPCQRISRSRSPPTRSLPASPRAHGIGESPQPARSGPRGQTRSTDQSGFLIVIAPDLPDRVAVLSWIEGESFS